METWKTDPALFRHQMCGIVRNAMRIIRTRRRTFVARPKPNDAVQNDVVTNVDESVQEFLARHFREQFPGIGILGEEKLTIPCTVPGRSIYVTIDPIDATRKLVGFASHGYSVMVSIVVDGDVVAACIGDVMASLLYWFAPGQAPACEDIFLGTSELLGERVAHPDQTPLLFGGPKERHHATTSHLCEPGQVFRGYEADHGSIGLRAARLWNGEVSACALRPNRRWTPWDDTPIIGFCRKLGYRYLAFDPHRFTVFDPPLVTEPTPCPYGVLIVHESNVPALEPWRSTRS